MADEADIANDYADKMLTSALLKHKRTAKHYDIESDICTGCSYATKSAWGKRCDGWRECLEDYDKADKAKRRNG